MSRIKAGIIGGAGYTGGELIRLLLLHPAVDLAFVQSSSNAGKPLYQVHTDLQGETDLLFSEAHHTDIDVLFLCGGHGTAAKFLQGNTFPDSLLIIDLSQDFRHHATASIGNRQFVYGLPELNATQIAGTKSIANPGCFATCIQLALLPLAAAQKLNSDIHITATTGSTGAGQSLSATSHFSWRDSNLSVYKAFGHQHEQEICESLAALQPGFDVPILFVPQRGNFTRGILAAIYVKSDLPETDLNVLFTDYYANHPFVVISDDEVDVKQVVNTNRCFIHVAQHNGHVLITAVIDNLLKGSCGQAVQNMNIVFGLDQKAGLHLKPSAF